MRITYVNNSNEESKVTAYVKTTPKGEKTQYKSIMIALADNESREVVLDRIKRELDSFIERNKHIEELADILIKAGVDLKAS